MLSEQGLVMDDIDRVVVQLGALARSGLLVDLDVRGVRRFSVAVLLPELGLVGREARAQGLQASRLLIPRPYYQALRSAERRCRRVLEDHSLDFLGAGSFRYVPATAWESFELHFAQAQASFHTVVDQMASHYPKLRAEALALAARIATEAWRSRAVRSLAPNSAAFRDELVRRVAHRFPSLEEVRAIRAEIRLARLVTVADLAEEQAREARARAEAEEAEARLRLSRQAEAAMRAALLEQARLAAQEALSPFHQYLEEIRERVRREAIAIRDSLRHQDPANINPRTLARCLGLVQTFRRLALLEDPELERELDRLSQAARRVRPGGRRRHAAPDHLEAGRALVEAVEAVLEAARPLSRRAGLKF